KGLLRALARTLPGEAFDFIIRDQIYFGVESPRERSERLHLFEVIVHSFDQNVFEGNHASFFLLVILTGSRQFTEGIFTVDRHEFVAGFIRGAMKRNREPKYQRFVGQLADLRSQAARRDGDFARANTAAPRRITDS